MLFLDICLVICLENRSNKIYRLGLGPTQTIFKLNDRSRFLFKEAYLINGYKTHNPNLFQRYSKNLQLRSHEE